MSLKTESAVLARFAEEIAIRISKKVVPALKGIKNTLSGDDSGLESVWEEICVQVQLEHSTFWEAYEEVLEGLLSEQVERLKQHEVLALWFQIDEGVEWLSADKIVSIEDEDAETPPVDTEAIVKYIANTKLYEIADKFTNRNIKTYLERNEE